MAQVQFASHLSSIQLSAFHEAHYLGTYQSQILMDDYHQNHRVVVSVVVILEVHPIALKALVQRSAPFAQLYLSPLVHLQSTVGYYDMTIPINRE